MTHCHMTHFRRSKAEVIDRIEVCRLRCMTIFVVGLVFCIIIIPRCIADEQTPSQSPPGYSEPYAYVKSVEGSCKFEVGTFSADGSAFLTVTSAGLRVWDTNTLRARTEPLKHDGVQCYRLVADGNTVFTAGGRELRLWDAKTSKQLSVTSVSCSPA